MLSLNSSALQPYLSAKLQNMMIDVLHKSSNHPLTFHDEDLHRQRSGKPFSPEIRACIFLDKNDSKICLKKLKEVTLRKQPNEDRNEISIAHELGHLLLRFFDFPIIQSSDDVQGELFNIMQHAVFFPLVKANYHFDLYQEANQRLREFLKNNHFRTQRGWEIDFIKYKVEANDGEALDQMEKTITKSLQRRSEQIDQVVFDGIISIQSLSNGSPNPDTFKNTYRDVFKNFGFSAEKWPKFAAGEFNL